MNENWLSENPDYIDILKTIIEYENENKNPDHTYIEDTDYDSCWGSTDVGVHPSKLYQLEVNGFLERVMDTNSTTSYTLSDRGSVEDMINDDRDGDGIRSVEYDFPDEESLPNDLFEDVIGYGDVKWLLKRALTTDDIVNVLLVGPPGSAKTVFLLSIKELEDSLFVSGSNTSGPGVLDSMFNQTPMNMCIDEFDDTPKETQEVLSQHMDTGILDETKIGKNRKLKINTNTFASANSTSPIIDQVVDRFVTLHFDPYTREEFIEICEHLLPRREGCSEDESKTIAEEVWDMEGSGDVRKAISVSRLSDGDPKKVLEVMKDYSRDGVHSL